MKRVIKFIAGLVLLVMGYLALWPVSINPQVWDAPTDQGYVGGFAPNTCLLYTSPSPRDQRGSRMPSSA